MADLGRWELRESGGNCLKYLEREAEQKGGEGIKDLKKPGASWDKRWVR